MIHTFTQEQQTAVLTEKKKQIEEGLISTKLNIRFLREVALPMKERELKDINNKYFEEIKRFDDAVEAGKRPENVDAVAKNEVNAVQQRIDQIMSTLEENEEGIIVNVMYLDMICRMLESGEAVVTELGEVEQPENLESIPADNAQPAEEAVAPAEAAATEVQA